MKNKILTILKKLQPEYEFEDGVDFIESGYLDSFAVVSLVAALEEEFKVRISALEIVPENFASVATICELVKNSR